jgi:hypothetical protein
VIILRRDLVEMDLAVQFDTEPFGRAVEIENVFSDAVLAAKFYGRPIGNS